MTPTPPAPSGPDIAVDVRAISGPFDIIGDVHGCAPELIDLLARLGYRIAVEGMGDERRAAVVPPKGRRAIFVGDLVDRGPASPDALRIAMDMVAEGHAFCVPGNHDHKFMRWLQGRNVKLTHGLDLTVAQMAMEPASFHTRVLSFLETLPIHLWLEEGNLVVAHAGIRAEMFGRTSGAVREFCLFGDTDGKLDADGLPIRYHWAAAYRSRTAVVYGHTPVPEPDWVNNTLCIDTGCCFGGSLTALRWPERQVVSVPARDRYAPQRRPFGHPPERPID